MSMANFVQPIPVLSRTRSGHAMEQRTLGRFIADSSEGCSHLGRPNLLQPVNLPWMRLVVLTRSPLDSAKGAAPKMRGASSDKTNKTGTKAEIEPVNADEEAAKMRKAVRAREKFMRHAGMADEFNLG